MTVDFLRLALRALTRDPVALSIPSLTWLEPWIRNLVTLSSQRVTAAAHASEHDRTVQALLLAVVDLQLRLGDSKLPALAAFWVPFFSLCDLIENKKRTREREGVNMNVVLCLCSRM